MSISPVSSSVKNQYNSGIISTLGASSTGSSSGAQIAGFLTNLHQAAKDQAVLAMNPTLAQTISEQAASPSLASSSQALKTLPGATGSTTLSQSSLTSLATSMQLLKSLSGSGALTKNSPLAQALLKNYTNPAAISSGSLLDTKT
ncbi:MAG: hypothetical protein P4L55_10085 [Syntrophobacteraceae bacterium]|nr:hypothetical protein [Syntrophobacteraceae bacterium]